MPNNYLSLSPSEFETLSADILSALHSVHFERYGEGRDGGVDGKFVTSIGGIWIVQAKRYRDVKALLRQMEHEQKKVLQLPDNIPSFSYEILNQENSGAAKARELAVKKSKTTYITLLDCDDKISSSYIELTLEAINNFPNVDILMPNMKIESQNGYIDFPFYSLKKTLTGDECLEHSLGEWRVHGVTCSKKELFLKSYSKYKEYNPSDENYINNDEVITRLNFYYSDEIVRTDAVYYYQKNPKSTTKK